MRYFRISEVECKHCGEVLLDHEFMVLMDSIRERVGEPLYINSWYRCEEWDANVGGKGNHTTGRAADIQCLSSGLRWKILDACFHLNVRRIGVHVGFVHVDIIKEKPQEVAWVY